MTDLVPTPQFTPLPTLLTSFVGRERDLDSLASLLLQPDVRLVTLTGPGGVGKSRLALRVAHDLQPKFADEVAFVGLAPVRDPTLVASAIASALGVAESGDEQPVAALIATLRRAEMLLVLDNFEQVLAAAPLVVTLLEARPRLTVLVTSRAALRVSGEREYPVLPLAVPAADTSLPDSVASTPAVRLFVERALAVDPSFHLTGDNAAAIAAICQRLDGLPLAIELAAARSKVLSPALLLPRLSRRLPLLTGGPRDVPARLQTMQDAITWSYELLTPMEQVLFRRLGVFVGGFTLDAAENVCHSISEAFEPHGTPVASVLDGITSLVDKSLLQWGAGQDVRRLGMLETIREFALERLADAGELTAAHEAHTAYFVTFGEDAEPNRLGPVERFDDRLRRIEAEQANLQVTLARLVEVGDADRVLQLAGALAVLWHHRSQLRQGRHWLEWALTQASAEPTVIRGRALAGLALLVWSQGEYDHAAPIAEEALIVAHQSEDAYLLALATHILGLVEVKQLHWDRAHSLMTRAVDLWRAFGSLTDEAMALHVLSGILAEEADPAQAEQYATRALGLFRQNHHPAGAAMALGRLATLACDRGDDRWALTSLHEARLFCSDIGDRWAIAQILIGLSEIASRHGQTETAARIIGAVDTLGQVIGTTVFSAALATSERAITTAQAALGEDRFSQLRTDGQTLRLEEAVTLAGMIAIPDPRSTPGVFLGGTSGSGSTRLTPREIEVLRLLVAGRTDRDIATSLFIGHRTVQDHVSHILGKLGVINRTEAATVATRDRLV